MEEAERLSSTGPIRTKRGQAQIECWAMPVDETDDLSQRKIERERVMARFFGKIVLLIALVFAFVVCGLAQCPGTSKPWQTTTDSSGVVHIFSCVNQSSGMVTLQNYADAGSQVVNVKAYGAVGDCVADDRPAVTAAYNAVRSGGTVYFPSGCYLMSSGLTMRKPVILRGVAGQSSIIRYTGSSGALLTFQWGTNPNAGVGAGVRDLTLLGPGHSSSTEGLHIGGSSASVGAVGTMIENVQFSQKQDKNTGFGTCIMTDSSGWGWATTILNSNLAYCDTGVSLTGEKNSIFGGILGSNVNGVVVASNSDATLTNVSLDSDSGAYVVVGRNGVATLTGCHLETNPVSLTAAGFIENGGRLTITGGQFLNDNTTGGPFPLITSIAGSTFVYVFGTDVYTAGQSFSALVTGPSRGGVSGVLAFRSVSDVYNAFDGTNPGRLLIFPSGTASHATWPMTMYGVGLEPSSLTVGSLPRASTSTGQVFTVTDSTAVTTEGQPCAGGSSNKALAFSNGTNWKCF